ncbi:MAG: hypothetical protein ABUS49_05465 [Acidobacteriota bacterium]
MFRSLVLLLAGFALPAAGQLAPAPPADYPDMRERFNAYLFRTYTDPARFAWLLVDSATDHWSRSPREWDRSAESYSYRVASGWGRRIIRNTAQLGFETVLHEDSRYRRSGEVGFGRRIRFAILHSVLAYKPDGSVEPMYGRMAAGVVAAATASTWHPQSISAAHLLNGVGQAAFDRAGSNLLTEFEPDLKNFGRKTWKSFHGK